MNICIAGLNRQAGYATDSNSTFYPQAHVCTMFVIMGVFVSGLVMDFIATAPNSTLVNTVNVSAKLLSKYLCIWFAASSIVP